MIEILNFNFKFVLSLACCHQNRDLTWQSCKEYQFNVSFEHKCFSIVLCSFPTEDTNLSHHDTNGSHVSTSPGPRPTQQYQTHSQTPAEKDHRADISSDAVKASIHDTVAMESYPDSGGAEATAATVVAETGVPLAPPSLEPVLNQGQASVPNVPDFGGKKTVVSSQALASVSQTRTDPVSLSSVPPHKSLSQESRTNLSIKRPDQPITQSSSAHAGIELLPPDAFLLRQDGTRFDGHAQLPGSKFDGQVTGRGSGDHPANQDCHIQLPTPLLPPTCIVGGDGTFFQSAADELVWIRKEMAEFQELKSRHK